jgi:hypothetical protein
VALGPSLAAARQEQRRPNMMLAERILPLASGAGRVCAPIIVVLMSYPAGESSKHCPTHYVHRTEPLA